MNDRPRDTTAFLEGGGEMGARLRGHDWSMTPLGPPAAWPQPLKTLLELMLAARQPMFMAWGPSRTLIYNDGYSTLLGERHPGAIGRPFLDVWTEVRDELTPLLNQVFAGESVHMDDIVLMLDRNGVRAEAHFAFSYTPIRDEQGQVSGLFCPCTETTSQIMTARHLAAERTRLAELFEQAPGFMAMLRGPEHRVELANRAYLELIGDRDVLGRPIAEAMPEVVEQGYVDILDLVYRGGQAYTSSGAAYERHGADGALVERFVDLVFQPIRDADGAVSGIFVEGADVTDRVHAEAGLVASEARLRALNVDLERQVSERAHARSRTWQVSPDLMGAINAEGRFETSNPAWQTLLGWTEADVASQTIFDLIHPHDLDRTRIAWDQAQAGQPVLRFPNRYRHKAGGYRWISWVAVPEGGKIYCSGRDITEEMEQAAALAERTAERDLLATIVATTDLFILALDLDYKVLAVNQAGSAEFERIYGQSIRIGDDILDRLAGQPAQQAEVRAFWERALAGEEFTGIAAFGDPARDRPSYEVRFNTLTDDGGQRIGAYQFVQDVTERLRAETALAATQEALRQSQKMEAVGQLTGGIAHDFNNMLAVVMGSLEMLGRRLDGDARTHRYIDGAMEGARRAAGLTQRLLAFSRQQPLRPEPIDVNRLVASLSELIRGALGSDIRFETVLDADALHTHADPNQMENVLLNLAVNARDAMPEGGRLTIRTAVAAPGRILIEVQDTGAGMTPEVMARAFDPFFTTKPVGRGTGLGLSQVHGFVHQSGGEVDIESQPGQGTTIRVVMPRIAPPAHAALPDQPGPLLPAQQELVLVVEDEPAVRQLSLDALRELGYRTLEADGAEAALQLLEAHPETAVLFTDVVMPEINGRRLADEARRRSPGLRVLFTTGYARDSRVEASLQPGIDLITKPYTIEALATKLRHVLEAPGPGP